MTGVIVGSLQVTRMSNKGGRINCGSISGRLRKEILLEDVVSYHARDKGPGRQREDMHISAMVYGKA